MTESYFLHRQATSTHVEKNHTGTNNCNKIIAIIKVSVPAGKKRPFVPLFTSYGRRLRLLSHAHPWHKSAVGPDVSHSVLQPVMQKAPSPDPRAPSTGTERACGFVLLLAMWQPGWKHALRTEKEKKKKKGKLNLYQVPQWNKIAWILGSNLALSFIFLFLALLPSRRIKTGIEDDHKLRLLLPGQLPSSLRPCRTQV